MAYICLLLSGAGLLINGLALLGYVPRRDSAAISLVIGSTQLALGVTHLGVADDGGRQVLLAGSGMLLFGLTYVYVGLDVLLGLGSKGLGWFCGMVGVFGLLLAAAWFRDDPLLAVLWLCWSVLWMLFFASMALGLERVNPFTGWALVLTSQVTATVPAFLGMAGLWPHRTDAAALEAALVAALFVLAAMLARRGFPDPRRANAGLLPDSAREAAH